MEDLLALELEIEENLETAHLQLIEKISEKLKMELELTPAITSRKPEENEMGIDAATAISIVGLTLSAINTAITVIEFYLSQRKNESIIIADDGSFTRHVSNINAEEAQEIINLIQKNKSKKLKIKVR